MKIEHVTSYRYETPASASVQCLRLTPPSFDGQKIVDWHLSSAPDSEMTASRDGYGNIVHLMTIGAPHDGIEITATGTVEIEDRHGVVRGLQDTVPVRVFLKRTALTAPDPHIVELANARTGLQPLAMLHELMAAIQREVTYETGTTTVTTTAAEALAARSGVCQDLAHIFISAARVAGIPARYVTGYLWTGEETPQSAAHHAWAETYLDGLGWVGFDVANGLCPTDHYVRLAAALDAASAAPVRGTHRGGKSESLAVAVRVEHLAMQQTQSQSQSQSQQQ